MSNQISKTGGATITGFSRSGFGCCARHTFCQMGKTTCYYAETDVEVPMLCAAYKRHHITSSPAVEVPTIEVKVVDTVSAVADTFDEDDDGQLSLF